jgi:hypothetical protein
MPSKPPEAYGESRPHLLDDSFGDQSAAIGKDAAKLGSSALKGLSHETERHPFFALAVAVGVGVLIGMVSRNWD